MLLFVVNHIMSFTAICKLCFALLISPNSHADNRESHEMSRRGD